MKKVKSQNTVFRCNGTALPTLVTVPSLADRAGAATSRYFGWPVSGLIAGGFFVFLVFGLFMPGRQTTATDSGGAIMAEQYVREGKITRLENGVAEFETTLGERFMLNPVSEGFRSPEVGSLQRVSLVPFRRSADNVYLARIRTMRKIGQYSPDSAGGS